MGGMISAIILTHNSEGFLGKTLESLAWCGERIVIDDASTDTTLRIAARHNTPAYTRKLQGDFAAQRNFGLEKVKGEWVLYVDSDEVVSKKLADEIQKSVTIDCSGFYLKRQDWMLGKKIQHGETNRVRLLRLARKDAGIWVRPVHEVWKLEGVVGTLVQPIDHFPHPNVAQFVDDINVYTTLNARYLFHENIRVPFWQILAYPAAKFFVDYIWYLGFLDGTPGAIIAIMMSMHSFLTRAKLWLLWHKHD